MDAYPDPTVSALAQLFREHPVWLSAARYVRDGASSEIHFSHRPGEPWHLIRREGRSALVPGPAPFPDFVFRFTPGSVRALAETRGDAADFALALFDRIASEDPETKVELRVVASFWRLMRRGYVRLLMSSGPRVARYGAARGVRSLVALRALVARSRAAAPTEWERRASHPRSDSPGREADSGRRA